MDCYIKDEIAKYVYDNYPEGEGQYTVGFEEFTAQGFTVEESTKALRRMFMLGLLSNFALNNGSYDFEVSPALEEFLESGGFSAQQKMLELQKAEIEAALKYLQLQIKKCEKLDASLFDHLTTGFNNIAQILNFGWSLIPATI
jgi:hypothetical protein